MIRWSIAGKSEESFVKSVLKESQPLVRGSSAFAVLLDHSLRRKSLVCLSAFSCWGGGGGCRSVRYTATPNQPDRVIVSVTCRQRWDPSLTCACSQSATWCPAWTCCSGCWMCRRSSNPWWTTQVGWSPCPPQSLQCVPLHPAVNWLFSALDAAQL